ncbi:hypothetical protein MPSEU_000197200 [Mayamaea pseudoterrestris]|nr:hypothetical protein MPSEU_000197200 [Mayamaea pseudoterrestris]
MINTMKRFVPMSAFVFARLVCTRAFSPTYRRTERISTSPIYRSFRFASLPQQLPSWRRCSRLSSTTNASATNRPLRINLSTISLAELEILITAWGHPKFRASQVYQWIHNQGITDVSEMNNIPKKLREQLLETTEPSSLELILEQESKDGTIKRAYRCTDGQVIESVLMPYRDGRYTACISSQAGCAQGCVFCATGQMGLARQLTSDEIFEQVARFSRELTKRNKAEQQASDDAAKLKQHGRQMRLSNVVFMGMGEPLANYRHVIKSIDRITNELGIGARKITVSTVGVVPNIRKLMQEPYQVRLAVSLHCATDAERTALLPANKRYGGLDELMTTLNEYITTTGRRLTFEWALIDGQNDSIDTARTLGRLIARHNLRRDMVHVNVIPLNPTGGFAGTPSQRNRVNEFCSTLEKEFNIACTPRVRRGIDIDAGCGQLKSKLTKDNLPQIGVYDEKISVDEDDDEDAVITANDQTPLQQRALDALDFDEGNFEDPQYDDDEAKQEVARLLNLVKGTRL